MRHKYLLLLLAVLWALPGKVAAGTENSGVYAKLVKTSTSPEAYTLYIQDTMDDGASYVTSGEGFYDITNALTTTIIGSKQTTTRSKVTKVVFTISGTEKLKPTNMAYWFSRMTGLTSVEGIENLSTENVTSMARLFYNCSALTSLDLSGLDATKVTDMNRMFYGCTNLATLNLSGFKTAAVTDLSYMFNNCTALTALDLSGFGTGNVTDMSDMFSSCAALASLDISGWNTANVTTMFEMFNGCQALTSLDVSNFTTSNVTNMANMFMHCDKATITGFENFDVSKVTSFRDLFSDCHAIEKVDLSKWNTESATDMSFMFQRCYALKSVDVSSFNTSKVTTFNEMFYDCWVLESLDLKNFDTSSAANMRSMFFNCKALQFLDASGFSSEALTDAQTFCSGDKALKELRIGNWEPANKEGMITNGKKDVYAGVGTEDSPCRLVKGFTRNDKALGTDSLHRDDHATRPPYNQYLGGYFYIADTLDASKDYTPVARTDGDLWLKERTLKADTWSSIVLPAGITATELGNALGTGVEVDYLYQYDGDTLRFKTLTGATIANTPYLVKTAEDVVNPAFVAVDVQAPASTGTATETNGDMTAGGTAQGTGKISKEDATTTFYGNYLYHHVLSKGYFGLANGKIRRSTGTAWVDPTVCYFQFSDIDEYTTAYKAKYVAFDGFDDSGNYTTSIARIEADGTIADTGKAYNLAGQRVGNGYKGIVIIGGKKILRR